MVRGLVWFGVLCYFISMDVSFTKDVTVLCEMSQTIQSPFTASFKKCTLHYGYDIQDEIFDPAVVVYLDHLSP